MAGMLLQVVMMEIYGQMETKMKKYILIFTLILSASLFAQSIQSHHSALLKKRGGATPETGEIFADDFEDGTLAAWSKYSTSGTSISIATDTVHSGTYSAKFVWDGGGNYNNRIAVHAANATKVYFRCYMYWPSAFVTGDGQGSPDLVSYYDGASVLVEFKNKGSASQHPEKWHVIEGTQSLGDANEGILFGQWFRFECGWNKATDSSWIKINGTQICEITMTRDYFVDSVKVGCARINEPINGYFYMDDIVIDSTGWVGAKP